MFSTPGLGKMEHIFRFWDWRRRMCFAGLSDDSGHRKLPLDLSHGIPNT
jgi:hypothetical protein